MPESLLIYDVGAHSGDDTAYYLSGGYSVVAIEANPALADEVSIRFASAIASGRLVVLNVGIADADGSADFWVCDDATIGSSFDRSIASRSGARHHSVRVATRRFAGVLAQYGVPFYAKIDIEGFDHFCIQDLAPDDKPRYVSIELNHDRVRQDLELLRRRGYTSFKVIDQVGFRPAGTHSLIDVAPRRARSFLSRNWQRARNRLVLMRPPSEGDWRFPYGSSGPFGEDTRGRWMSFEATARWVDRLLEQERQRRTGELARWFDIHARED